MGKLGKRELRSLIQASELKTLKRRRLSNVSQGTTVTSHVDEGGKRMGKKRRRTKGLFDSSKKMIRTAIDSYTIPGTRKIVKAGDTVLIQAPEREKPPYVAKIEKIQRIQASRREKTVVKIRWFYHPEETISRRRSFHGAQEVCLSDHYDSQDADCIQDKCNVHTFKEYCKLKEVDRHDYFWRFEYKAALQVLSPEVVDVYCSCEMPYNPDHFMVQCEACSDWFHPSCVKLSREQVANMDTYVCADCSP
ncbi:hypothetical protein Mapa_000075 [Marchantia paleacea]|nr:hypothetical protein Mapa_000075 [Marchantia paleacea]